MLTETPITALAAAEAAFQLRAYLSRKSPTSADAEKEALILTVIDALEESDRIVIQPED